MVLRGHRARQAEHLLGIGHRLQEEDLVFSDAVGDPLHGRHVTTRSLRQVLERAELPRIRFHDLRHTAATLLLASGVPVEGRKRDAGPHDYRYDPGCVRPCPTNDAGRRRAEARCGAAPWSYLIRAIHEAALHRLIERNRNGGGEKAQIRAQCGQITPRLSTNLLIWYRIPDSNR
jgi:hypothetical protein